MENCRHFISYVSPRIPVREMPVAAEPESDSQVQMEDSQVISPDSQQVSRGTTRGADCSSIVSAAASGLTLSDLAQKVACLLDSRNREGGGVGVCKVFVQKLKIRAFRFSCVYSYPNSIDIAKRTRQELLKIHIIYP